jgi:hypothetical protein
MNHIGDLFWQQVLLHLANKFAEEPLSLLLPNGSIPSTEISLVDMVYFFVACVWQNALNFLYLGLAVMGSGWLGMWPLSSESFFCFHVKIQI